MFLTIREIATKYKIEEVGLFGVYLMDNHREWLLNNPDVSVSDMEDIYVMNSIKARQCVYNYLTPSDTPDPDKIDALKSLAVAAMARYVAATNQYSYVDWFTDMRLEDVDPGPRSDFMTDVESVNSVLEDIGARISPLLADLQK